jgi:trehalose 6-phosphate synthase/phosphatase
MRFHARDWQAYRDVNRAFADKILEIARPGDRVWVHDYHLMLLPKLLADADLGLKIAYFHHIPFPSSEIFRTLPCRTELLHGLLGASYVAFHTHDYARHFMSAVARTLGYETDVDRIHTPQRIVKAAAHPLGIDFEAAAAAPLPSPDDPPKPAALTYLGIDRLDYTKGIPERLAAFRDLLREHADLRGKATFLQLCVPSRPDVASYGHLKNTVDRLVGQINGEFGAPGYTPVQYFFRSLPADDVKKLYRMADVAVVTPLRDGLNLVCKEYVAARDDDDGVLILSEFAGAASEMGEALIVNPFDVKALSDAMATAARMPQIERRRRMMLLRARVKERDNRAWARTFISAWRRTEASVASSGERLAGQSLAALLKACAKGERAFLFIDNDGTMTPIASRPELAVPPPDMLALLAELSDVPGLITTIVTGRPRTYCDQYFGGLPVAVMAEHGVFYKPLGGPSWEPQIGSEDLQRRMLEMMPLLRHYTDCLPGSHIEIKESAVVWHYRQANPDMGPYLARELSGALHQLLASTSLAVHQGLKVVEIRPANAHKGVAVDLTLSRYGATADEPIITVGDDTTDDDMHRAHPDRNLSVHVGRPSPFARYYVRGPNEVKQLVASVIACRRGDHLATAATALERQGH